VECSRPTVLLRAIGKPGKIQKHLCLKQQESYWSVKIWGSRSWGDMRLTEVSPAFWKPIFLSRVLDSSWHGARSWAVRQRAATKRQRSLQNFRTSGATVTKMKFRSEKSCPREAQRSEPNMYFLLEVWLTELHRVRGSEAKEMKGRTSIFSEYSVDSQY